MVNNDQTPEDRERTRQVQLAVLKSEPILNLYIAAIGRDVGKFGEAAKQSSKTNYLKALNDSDEYVGKFMARAFGEAAKEAMTNGRDIYSEPLVPSRLLDNSIGFYQSAIGGVKVRDVLDLMGITDVHEGNISASEQDMYMKDYKEVNKDIHDTLYGIYFDSIQRIGIGQSLADSGNSQRKGLEKMLQENPNAEAD